MSEEISKNTIIVLVILTVVISLLGTVTVLNEVNKVKPLTGSHDQPVVSGKVSLTITQPSGPVTTTGKVVLEKSH